MARLVAMSREMGTAGHDGPAARGPVPARLPGPVGRSGAVPLADLGARSGVQSSAESAAFEAMRLEPGLRPARPMTMTTTQRRDPVADARPPSRLAGPARRRDVARRRVSEKAVARRGARPLRATRACMFDLPVRDRALARAIVGVSLRRRGQLDHVLNTFSRARPADRSPARSTRSCCRVRPSSSSSSTPPHAAIDLAVRLAQWDPRAKRYDKLANAVLRRVSEKGEALLRWSRRGPHQYAGLAVGALGRLLGRGTDPRDCRSAAGRAAARSDREVRPANVGGASGGTACCRRGAFASCRKGRIEELPGFEEGEWWVQDAAASLPAQLLGDVAGKRVADLCAAPGGKTAQLALAGASVVAVDSSSTRLEAACRQSETARAQSRDGARGRRRLAAGGALRRDPARCALFLYRHDQTPSRHSLSQDGEGHRGTGCASRPGCSIMR